MKLYKRVAPTTLLLSVALTGCSGPETPQEVTQAFWEAVLAGDAEEVAELSTLVDERGFDDFSLNWSGAEVTWGRVTVEGQEASIDTVFSDLPRMKGEKLETTTHLVRVNDQWQVDYYQTGDEIDTDIQIGGLIGSFRELGDKLRSRLSDESEKASQELNRLLEEWSAYSEETRKDLSALIEQYGGNLEQRIENLSRSLDDALKQNPSASKEERQTIEQARKDLQRQQQALEENQPDAVAEVGKELAQIQEQLSELSDQSFEHLKEQLQRWSRELNQELEQLNREARMKEQHSI